MSQNQYFRVGSGSVIYNEKGEILLFRRADNQDLWQFQQGGMDRGETSEETLWRELLEETGLTQNDIELVTKYPDWLLYEYKPTEIRATLKDPNCFGQAHQWYFLKLGEGVEVDLEKAVDKEFVEVKWSTFEHLLSLPDTFKHHVFKALSEYFATNIQK